MHVQFHKKAFTHLELELSDGCITSNSADDIDRIFAIFDGKALAVIEKGLQ